MNRQHSQEVRFKKSGMGRHVGRLRFLAAAALGVAVSAWSAQDGKVTAYRIRSKEPREVPVRVNGEVKKVNAELLK